MRGHIHKRVRKTRSGKETTLWYVVVDIGGTADGRRRQKWHGGFATPPDAEVARAKIVSDLHSGAYIAPDRIRFDEWVRRSWLPMIESRVKPSTFHSNIAERAKPPRPSRRARSEIQCWEPEELARFLEHVNGTRLEAGWRLAAMTGMRRGEILGLRWRDVDLDTARIAIRQAVVSVGYSVLYSTPKSHQARVIDLDPETIELLSAHRRHQIVERDRWGSEYQDADLVVAKENGEPIHPHTSSQAFDRLVKRAGLRRIRLHDLRHTHATIAARAGVPVKVISERLGHESPAFTLKQYAHVMPGMQADAARRVAEVIGTTHEAPAISDTQRIT